MIGLYIFPFCWALGACFLELLNLEVIQRGMDMNWQEYNLTLLSSSQPVVPSASSYDWVSTVSIALIVLTYILITILVVILVKRGGIGKNHASLFNKGGESQTRTVDDETAEEQYTAHASSILHAASRIVPSIKQWTEVKKQVESSELPVSLQERYLNALAHFDKQRFEEVGSMAKHKLTESDKRYMICFIVGMSMADIATIFHVEPTSLYTMKYRIKKKFPPELIDYIEFL